MESTQPEHTDAHHTLHRVLDSLVVLPPLPLWPDLN
jgi:hypothetical protein